MRFISALSLLSLLLGTRASSHDLREPASHRRDILDICVFLDLEVKVPDITQVLTGVGLIEECLCLSALPLFLESNTVAIAAVKVAGIPIVTKILADLILGEAAKSSCEYPEHSHPACSPEHPLCGFTCDDGFTASYDPPACVCEAPFVLCNGVCQESGPCASARANPDKKKRWVGSGACAEKGAEWAACGVYGGRPHAYECVNTARDLESCGGCAIPLSPYSPVGEDCSAIAGVADVACLYGECVVFRCLPGFEPSHDGHSCVRTYSQYDDGQDVFGKH